MNLSNPTELKALLNKYDFSFSKSLGQNFLTDKGVLDKIISAADIKEGDFVLEIGPGAGTLTRRILKQGAKCVAVEIDKALLPIIGEATEEFEKFCLVNEDILKVDIKELTEKEFDGKGFKVVANLPYYITTPIVMKLLEDRLPIISMVLMVQKEVADRMCAKEGGKDYGALSVAVNYYCQGEKIVQAMPHCFIPQPKVASSVVLLKRIDEKSYGVNNEKLFFAIVKSAFSQRRKTLVNALSKSPYVNFEKEVVCKSLNEMGLREDIRGEKLSVESFARLSNLLEQAVNI